MAPTARHTDERDSSLSWPDDSPGGTVLARTERGRTVVELHGEIDLAVVLATTPQLYALTTAARPDLVADLREVTFIDCSGLAMLVDVRSRALAADGTFTMVCADPKVLRLLRITGLDTVLAPVAELTEPELTEPERADLERADLEQAGLEQAGLEPEPELPESEPGGTDARKGRET